MNTFAYLTTEIPNYVSVPKRFSYFFKYGLLTLKRFIALNVMAFSFQYLCIYHLASFYPIYPIYPAIGISFAIFYILGENAMGGLLLGSVCAYYLKGFMISSMVLYSIADIGCALLGAYVVRNIMVSDIPKHMTGVLWLRFIGLSSVVCFLSAVFRWMALMLHETMFPSFSTMVYIYLDLWLADLNAIIVFYAFLSMWLSIYMSREKISSSKIGYYHIAAFLIFIAISLFMLKKIEFIYLLCFGMGLTWVFAYIHKLVIATLLIYVISMLYLGYFMTQQLYYLKWLKLGGYTMVPACLLLFILGGIFLASERKLQDLRP